MTSQELNEAVEIIVSDILYFDGCSPLHNAKRTKKLTQMIIEQSNGYTTLKQLVSK